MITSNEAGSLRKRGYSSRPAMERSLVSSSSIVPEDNATRSLVFAKTKLRKALYGVINSRHYAQNRRILERKHIVNAGVNRGMRRLDFESDQPELGVRDVASWLYESFKEWNAICHMPFAPHHPWSTRTSLPLSMSNPMEESIIPMHCTQMLWFLKSHAITIDDNDELEILSDVLELGLRCITVEILFSRWDVCWDLEEGS
jgi:hypothetical protein